MLSFSQALIPGSLRTYMLSLTAWAFLVLAGVAFQGRLAGAEDLPKVPEPSPTASTAAAPSPQAQAASLKQEAVSAAKEVADAYPQEALAYALLGSAYYNIGQSEAATRHLKRCLELSPGEVQAYEVLARAAYERGELEECVRLIREALKHAPPNPELLNRLGRAQQDLGETQEAIRTLEQSSGLRNAPSESHYLLGQAHLQAGHFDQAKSYFQKTIDRVPDHTQAYFGLFTACLRLGQSEEASRDRQEFLKLEEADRRSHTDRSGQEEGLTGLPMVRETVARTLFGAAQIQRAHGQSDKSAEFLKRSATLDPENPNYRAALESIFMERKALPEGLATFQKMVSDQPRSSMNLLFLGRFQARVQDMEGAERSYRQVIELAPKKPEGHRALADLFLRANRQLTEATTHALAAIELDPSGSNYHLLALVYLKNNDRPRALEAARQAVARSPGDAKYAQLLQKLEASLR